MTSSWYVIQSHPNKEQLLYKQIENLGYEVFYPKIRVKPVNPRARKIRPYFPGYLFLRTDIETIGMSTFRWMPYSKGVVSFGREPALVPESLINAIKLKIRDVDGTVIVQKEEIEAGVPVSIKYGSFEGYEGIFDTKLNGSDRVRILLKMLGDKYVPVVLEIDQIQKKDKRTNKP